MGRQLALERVLMIVQQDVKGVKLRALLVLVLMPVQEVDVLVHAVLVVPVTVQEVNVLVRVVPVAQVLVLEVVEERARERLVIHLVGENALTIVQAVAIRPVSILNCVETVAIVVVVVERIVQPYNV